MELIPIAFYALRWVHEGIHALLLRLLGAHVTWRRRGRIWPDTDAPDAPRAKRIVGALLTPAVLYLAGVALPAAVLLALLGGRPVSTATVESVRPDMPGEAAGLRAGDEVVAVGDVRTPDGDTLRGELGRYPDRSVTLRIRRAGAHLTLQATPRRTPDGAALGVVLGSRVERPGVIEALQQGVTMPLMIVAAQVVAVGDLFGGDAELVGPVGMVGMARSMGTWDTVLLMMTISALAFGWLLMLVPFPTSALWRAGAALRAR